MVISVISDHVSSSICEIHIVVIVAIVIVVVNELSVVSVEIALRLECSLLDVLVALYVVETLWKLERNLKKH